MYFSIFIKEDEDRIQAFNTWRPYEFKVNRNFWLTWIHEFIGHFVVTGVHMAADSMVPGFFIQLCCQLKFLQHRLKNFPDHVETMQKTLSSNFLQLQFESTFISKSVTHHNTIFE